MRPKTPGSDGGPNVASKYYVIGGEYADTDFTTLAEGRSEERYGPFATEKEAHDFWRGITGRTVDNAMVRYRIRPDEELRGKAYYVVGGEYSDTTFREIAPDRVLETYGPFTRREARDFWRGITGRTVDSALTRYDIRTEEELDRP